MTDVVPTPSPDCPPVLQSANVTLNPGQKGTITMRPETAGSTHRIPTVAISKASETNYSVTVDGNTRYPGAAIPPTDIDDFVTTFIPSLRLRDKLEITIKDVRSSGAARTYYAQVQGWEA